LSLSWGCGWEASCDVVWACWRGASLCCVCCWIPTCSGCTTGKPPSWVESPTFDTLHCHRFSASPGVCWWCWPWCSHGWQGSRAHLQHAGGRPCCTQRSPSYHTPHPWHQPIHFPLDYQRKVHCKVRAEKVSLIGGERPFYIGTLLSCGVQ
jgi:hypothetical protein